MTTYWVVKTYSKKLIAISDITESGRNKDVISSKGALNEQCLLEVIAGDPDYQKVDGDPGLITNRAPAGASALSLSEDTTVKDAVNLAQFNTDRDAKFEESRWKIERHRDQVDDPNVTTPNLTTTQYNDWLAYRQELRDMPTQGGFDTANPSWPTVPSS